MSTIYHFGAFRLDPAARELWQADRLTELPRRTFDGLVFLVEHRDRAISRDELIDALWGRPVEDIQVTQLIMRLRRLLGDDSQEPRFIRAVPGFGYRWIADVDERATPPANGGGPPEPVAGNETTPPAIDVADTAKRRGRPLLWALLALAVLAAAAYLLHARPWQAAPLPRAPNEAIVVLPLQVVDAERTDAGWARLGAMDLVAERLRDAGLPVPPSESVISALQAVPETSRDDPQAAIRGALAAQILVEGAIRPTDDGWTVALTATTSRGQTRRVEAARPGIIPAARQAADLLLAALGHPAPAERNPDEALEERLQRARAAGLALELDTARAILTDAPPAMRDDPELRHELAWVEMRAGRPEAVMAITSGLLDDPDVVAQPRLHAKVLTTHGIAGVNQAGHWTAGEAYFDAAVAVLDHEPWAPELGRALTLRSAARTVAHRFDDAARDLGRARALFEASGDRRGMAQVENYAGNLELERGRPAEAVPHYRNAIEIDSGFSQPDALRANLSALQRAQMQLLRWPDALDTSERLWALRDEFRQPVDPHRLHSLQMHRIEVLLALGRRTEAEAMLSSVSGIESGVPAYGLRYEMELRARLAWEHGDAAQALELSAQALALWQSEANPPTRQPIELALLHQRASIAAGEPVAAADILPAVPETVQEPAYLIARAEWAAHEGDADAAERYFRQAAQQAESRAVPATFVQVADAYARWLLARGRTNDALAVAGRVAEWADADFDTALLQLAVLHASGREDAWAAALDRTRGLAGERDIPAALLRAPE